MKRPDESEVERLRDMIGMNVKPRAKPELIDAMEQASAKRIIYLFAPSGYGKTASALRWLEKQAARQAWIDLGEEDNDPAVFYSRLASAFQNLQPDNEAVSDILSNPEDAGLLNRLAKEALHMEKARQILVLDSFQEITNKALMKQLTALIGKLPAKISVLIISKEEPDGVFSDLVLREKMSVINKTKVVF